MSDTEITETETSAQTEAPETQAGPAVPFAQIVDQGKAKVGDALHWLAKQLGKAAGGLNKLAERADKAGSSMATAE